MMANKLQNIAVKGSARQCASAAFVCALLAFALAFGIAPCFAWAEPESDSTDGGTEISAAAHEITVAATLDSVTNPGYSVSVTYDDDFKKGKKIRFTYNVTGTNGKPLKYKVNSFQLQTSSGWISMVDPSRGEAKDWTDKNYFEEEIYSPGKYQFTFLVGTYTDLGDGLFAMSGWTRYKIEFTVPPTDDMKTIESIVTEVADKCKAECAAKGDTSQYAYALWLNDWIVDNTSYDMASNNAEGVFNRRAAGCEGYHEAYCMLLNKVGIETRRVDSSRDNHVWTGAKLDGAWYNIDTTWNDPGYTYSDGLDLRHLYFAIPNNIMKLAHENWDGNYSVNYPDRAPFDGTSYAANYFIKSGAIGQYTAPYLAASGTYSVKAKLAANERTFTLPLGNYTWSTKEKAIIYSLVAYQLSQENWGDGIKLDVTYQNGALSCKAAYSLEKAQVSDIDAVTFNGKAYEPRPTVTFDGRTLTYGTDYKLSYSNNKNASTASNPAVVTVTGVGDYAGTIQKTFTIKQLDLSLVTIDKVAFPWPRIMYTGSAIEPKPAIRTGDATLDASCVQFVYANNLNVGEATITIKPKDGNCVGSQTTTFEITVKPITHSSIAVSAPEVTYDGNAKHPVVVKDGSRTLKEGTDYSITYSNNVNVGTAKATITGINNYNGVRTVEFTIKEKPSTSSGGNTSSSGTAATPPAATNSSGSNSAVTPSKPTTVTTQAKPQTQSVSGTWQKSGGRWWFAYDSKTQTTQKKQWPVNEWVTIGGKSYHFDGSGYMHTNWQKLNNNWYYFASDGAMRTGWQKSGGKWYYLHTDGIMRTGKINPGDGKTYYFTSSGAMKTGWNKEGAGWYFYTGSGAMAKGWTKAGGKWYYLDPSTGLMRTGFYKVGNTWYYSNSSGTMLTGWQKIGGKYYYFNGSGVMQYNKWIGNYWVKDNGVMATSERVDGGKYYVDGSGKWVRGK